MGTPELLETRCVGFRPTLPREELFSLGFEWGGRKSPYCAFTAVTVHPYVVGPRSVPESGSKVLIIKNFDFSKIEVGPTPGVRAGWGRPEKCSGGVFCGRWDPRLRLVKQ